jgi:hypothetical protein
MAFTGRHPFYEWYKHKQATFLSGLRIITDPFYDFGESGIFVYDNIGIEDAVPSLGKTYYHYENKHAEDYNALAWGLFIADDRAIQEWYVTAPFYASGFDNIGFIESVVLGRTYLAFDNRHAEDANQYGPGLAAFDNLHAADYPDVVNSAGFAETIGVLDIAIVAIIGSATGQYRDGAVTVTDGSDTVIGINTFFQNYVRAGSLFQIVPDTAWYEVKNVQNYRRLTLTAPYHGEDVVNTPYVIHQLYSDHRHIPILSKYDEQWNEIYNRAIRTIDKEVNDLLKCMYYHPDSQRTIEGTSVSEYTELVTNLFIGGYDERHSEDYSVFVINIRVYDATRVTESVSKNP